jgi:protein-tyrosine phosphatase
LIDIHCHILPGLDDGPQDLDAALVLVTALVEVGFTELYPTPHQKSGSWAPTADERERAARELGEAVREAGLAVSIHPPAGENMWDDLFLERLSGTGADIVTYPGNHAFLVELDPAAPPPNVEQQLFQLRVSRGQLPVVAHVERYPSLTRDRARLEGLARNSALLVNLSALGGMGGWGVRRLARRLVKQRLVHAAASDGHTMTDAAFCQAGADWLRSTLGEQALCRLLLENPRRILAGDLPEW